MNWGEFLCLPTGMYLGNLNNIKGIVFTSFLPSSKGLVTYFVPNVNLLAVHLTSFQ